MPFCQQKIAEKLRYRKQQEYKGHRTQQHGTVAPDHTSRHARWAGQRNHGKIAENWDKLRKIAEICKKINKCGPPPPRQPSVGEHTCCEVWASPFTSCSSMTSNCSCISCLCSEMRHNIGHIRQRRRNRVQCPEPRHLPGAEGGGGGSGEGRGVPLSPRVCGGGLRGNALIWV